MRIQKEKNKKTLKKEDKGERKKCKKRNCFKSKKTKVKVRR